MKAMMNGIVPWLYCSELTEYLDTQSVFSLTNKKWAEIIGRIAGYVGTTSMDIEAEDPLKVKENW